MKNEKKITVSILSLSLLTVMAGAAVAPALGVIKAYFSDLNQSLVQMIISMPALFIVLTSFVFPYLCRKFGSKTLVMAGLILYTVGGCCAGLFSNIYAVLAMRAFVGMGVGIIMPLSTGLLSYYFSPEKLGSLMGYSSAMNQMGGVVATLLAGLLCEISWRCSFLVYLMGFAGIIPCLLWLPNDRIAAPEKEETGKGTFGTYFVYIAAMFLLMSTFFIYPANFAIETVKAGVIPQGLISVIMAGMDFVAFIGGLLFVRTRKCLKGLMRFLAPALFLAGYVLLISGSVFATLAGSVFIGFANGAGIPFIISEASMRAGKSAATTVMPLLSAALYLAQFVSPILLSGVTAAAGDVNHLPYIFAAALALLFCLCSAFIPKGNKAQ